MVGSYGWHTATAFFNVASFQHEMDNLIDLIVPDDLKDSIPKLYNEYCGSASK